MHESDRRKEYEEEIKKLKLEIKEVRERYYQNSLSLSGKHDKDMSSQSFAAYWISSD